MNPEQIGELEEPLERPWERAAVKELADVLILLAHGVFRSPQELTARLLVSTRSIEIFYPPEEQREND